MVLLNLKNSLVQLDALLEPTAGLLANWTLEILLGHIAMLVNAVSMGNVICVAGQLLVGIIGNKGQSQLLENLLVISDDFSLIIKILDLIVLTLPVLVDSAHYKSDQKIIKNKISKFSKILKSEN